MCVGSKPKAPDPQPIQPGPLIMQDQSVQQAGEEERKRLASRKGYQSTLLSSGDSQASTMGKALFGE